MADINEFRTALELFKDEVDPEVNVNLVLIFLEVARRGVCNQKDVEVVLNLTNATASRGVSWWSDAKRPNIPGMGFIARGEDPTDRRYKLLRLTSAGLQFYDKLKAIRSAPAQRAS